MLLTMRLPKNAKHGKKNQNDEVGPQAEIAMGIEEENEGEKMAKKMN